MVKGTFTGTGSSDTTDFRGVGLLSLSGISSSTVVLKRSTDSGANWRTVESFTADEDVNIYGVDGAILKLECTVYGSGTIVYSLGMGNGE